MPDRSVPEKTRNHPDVEVMRIITHDIPSTAETDHKTTDRREKDGRL